MKKKKPVWGDKVYVAGKITHTDLAKTKRRFARKEIELSEMCVVKYNPMKSVDLNKPLKPWLFYMKVGIGNLMNCNSIYMLKGWRRSKGARIERWLAKKLKYDVYYE